MYTRFLFISAIAIVMTILPNRVNAQQFSNYPQIDRHHIGLVNDNACMEYAGGFVVAKTKSFYIEICGSKDRPLSFYSVKKKFGNTVSEVNINLKNYTFNNKKASKSEKFIAVNGNTQYNLNRNFLTVTKDGKIVSKEKVISYQRLIN
jgi:hypothetical protein